MSLCSVLYCGDPAGASVQSSDAQWLICDSHMKRINAGAPWGALEDNRNLLLGQVVLPPPALQNWKIRRTSADGVRLTIKIDHTTGFTFTLTKEQSFELARALQTSDPGAGSS